MQKNEQSFMNRFRRLERDEAGVSTVEYIVVLILVAIVAITAWRQFGQSLTAKANFARGEIENLGSGTP